MAILHHFEDFDYFVIQGFLSTFRFLSYPLNYVNPAQTLITKQLAFRAICRNTLFRIL